MKLSILTSALVCGTMLTSSAYADDFNGNRVESRGITVTTGHALQNQRMMSAQPSRAMKALPAAGISTKNAGGAVRNGLSINPRSTERNAVFAFDSSAVLFEGFEEGTSLFSDATPAGWSIESKGQEVLGTDDHWLGFSKAYADYYMFAPPAEGQMMFGVFYNDDYYKDEWLVSSPVTVPGEGYEVSFYWYTLPYYMYVIDRFHVDFENKVFIDREVLFDVEVLARVEGEEEWTKIYSIENQFSDMEYYQLEYLDYAKMQRAAVNIDEYAGKTVQLAFRYWGQAGNTFCLDAVRVDKPIPNVSYMPDYSRLFYGFDPEIWWMDASIEFYPVNHEVSWYNNSDDFLSCDYNWLYSTLNDNNDAHWQVSEDRYVLNVTYHPDYTSEASLRNNFYYLPKLKARDKATGAISDFATCSSDFLQAGGTTEFEYTGNDGGVTLKKYTATNFDIRHEGLGIYLQEDEQLGFLSVPIFGYNVNADAWWEHYCFPDGKMTEDQYAYVDGFVNKFFPHPTAPLVVNGVSAAAIGTITDEAVFTMKIYTMTAEGVVIDTPIAQKTIFGSEVTKPDQIDAHHYLVLNFPLDEPVVLDSNGTGYAYLVEISGYRDPMNVEFFAPLQSTMPNEYEWALSFYHIYRSGKENDLTNQMSYVAFFTDDWGRDLYNSFAIGLDAHYPWLELVENENTFTRQDDGSVKFQLHGYYDSYQYIVEVPEEVNVKMSGHYITDVTVTPKADCTLTSVPLTIKAPGVSLKVNVPIEGAGIGSVTDDHTDATADVYNAQGIKVMEHATDEDINHLPAGIYIFGGKKVIIR